MINLKGIETLRRKGARNRTASKSKGIEDILSLHKPKRYVSAPDPAAEEAEYILGMFHDAIERGIIPPDTSIEKFRKELHDYDHGKRQQTTPRRYAKSDEPFDPIKEALKLFSLRQQLSPDQLLVVDDLVEKMTKPQTDNGKQK